MSWWKTAEGDRREEQDAGAAGREAEVFPASGGKRPDGVYREQVLVRVYDLGRTFLTRWHNQVTRGYGAFHTGVEVYGREWSFGMTFDDWSTGITWDYPTQNPYHCFRETLSMGYTQCSPRQVMQIIDEMKITWKGCTYNVLSRNCHNFSDELCGRLGAAPLPAWINDLAYTGAEAVEYLDSDGGRGRGRTIADYWSSMKSSVYNTFVAAEPEPSEPSANEEEDVRRQRLEARVKEAHRITAWLGKPMDAVGKGVTPFIGGDLSGQFGINRDQENLADFSDQVGAQEPGWEGATAQIFEHFCKLHFLQITTTFL